MSGVPDGLAVGQVDMGTGEFQASRKPLSLREMIHFTDRQMEAWEAVKSGRARYLLYGGAMGGGKSYFLRWSLILSLIHWGQRGQRNVRVGLFCEDYPALHDRHLCRLAVEVPSWLGRFNQQDRELTLHKKFGSGQVCFRNLDDPSKYQSSEFAMIGIDELTKSPKEVFDMLRTRLRWPGIDDTRFVGATNPGGVGHLWVKRLWVDRAFERYEREQSKFVFIPAKATDNPYLPESYYVALSGLPDDKREAYVNGDWSVFSGQFFSEWSAAVHVVRPFKIPAEWARFISMDYGFSAPSSVGWYAVGPDRTVYRYRELYRVGMTYSQLGLAVLQGCGSDRIDYAIADPAVWGDRAHHRDDTMAGESGGETLSNWFWPGDGPDHASIREKRKDGGVPESVRFPLMKGDNERLTGWGRLREMMKPYKDQHGEDASRLRFFSTCKTAISILPTMVYDETKTEDLDTDSEDHVADEVRYAVMSRPRENEPVVRKTMPTTSEAVMRMKIAKMLSAKKRRQNADATMGANW